MFLTAVISSGCHLIPKRGMSRLGGVRHLCSPKIYNQKSGLALVCPVTNQAKGYPFEVTVPIGHGVTGVILADHVRSVDWKARQAEELGRCSDEVVNEVLARLAPLLGY